jgi:hypothetical protein
MSTMEMDPVFTAALRAALVATVKDTPRVRRRWRWRVGTGTFLGGLGVGNVFSPGCAGELSPWQRRYRNANRDRDD